MYIYPTLCMHTYKRLLQESQSDVTEGLYRNKEDLETIFRAIDADHSGIK